VKEQLRHQGLKSAYMAKRDIVTLAEEYLVEPRRLLLAQAWERVCSIERVEAFGEPAVDRSEEIAGLIQLAPIAPQPRHAHRRAQFPGLCLALIDGVR
jgi:hypothetical protein